ncbi:T9SS type A sorting domain-containing protein [Flavobacterium sp.]|jgi:hypothetical protein|uniref:T9SS type A sorting domain-containing protein n=1 Tax=Flavobacterium sp. TaxID=239 RepID=UPI0037BFF72C
MKNNYKNGAPFYWTVLAFFIVQFGWGQTNYYWNCTSVSPTTGSNSNITSVEFGTTAGNNNGTTTLISTGSSSSGYSGSSGTSNFGAACKVGSMARASSTYFSIIITPSSNYRVKINSISFGSRGTSTGPQNVYIYSSIDNFTTSIGNVSVTNNSSWGLKNISFEGTNLNRVVTGPVTIRIYGADGSGSPSVNTANWRIDDVNLSVTDYPVTTWNGTTWSNSAPTSTVDAVINGDYTETADISCKDLTINSGKTLTIGASNSLTVAGNLVNDGNLIFKSTSAGTARFASYSGAAITSSNITVERYLPAKRAWRLLTAPLKGSSNNTVGTNWQGTDNEGLLLFSPATYQSTTMTGYTTGGGSPNIWNYENGWQKITNISTETMFNTNNSDTKSYLVFATGPHGSNTIAGTTTPLATTLKPVGQLITGSVAHSLTANQFKLLPNPYASPLNTAGLVTSNSGTTIWMVDPTLNTFGGYFTFNGTEWTPTTPSASDAYIQSGQGFFVKNAANTTFTIAESHKVSGNSNTWFERTTTDTSVDKIRVLLYKQDNSAWQLADGVLAVNSASGNHEVDAADADKMTNFNENLLFKNGTSNLAIEYRGLPAAGTLQPMQLTGTSVQPYELRIKTENYSNSNLTPYLENTQTGVLTAIPTDGSEVIVPFTGIAATSAAPDSRFRIVYQAPLSSDDLNNLVVGVYPNPVHESLFTIELAKTNSPARYSLTNLLGQVVQEGSLVSLTNAIPVHDLSEGMYLLQINQEGKRFTTKLMIK